MADKEAHITARYHRWIRFDWPFHCIVMTMNIASRRDTLIIGVSRWLMYIAFDDVRLLPFVVFKRNGYLDKK